MAESFEYVASQYHYVVGQQSKVRRLKVKRLRDESFEFFVTR
jgi:hypothetical protein